MTWDTDARKAVHVLTEHRGAVSATGFTRMACALLPRRRITACGYGGLLTVRSY
jgi:hypothetical protein